MSKWYIVIESYSFLFMSDKNVLLDSIRKVIVI